MSSFIYTVVLQQRSINLEKILAETDDEELCVYDSFDPTFQSLDLKEAKDFYDKFKPFNNGYYYSVYLYLTKTRLGEELIGDVDDDSIFEKSLLMEKNEFFSL